MPAPSLIELHTTHARFELPSAVATLLPHHAHREDRPDSEENQHVDHRSRGGLLALVSSGHNAILTQFRILGAPPAAHRGGHSSCYYRT